MIAPRSIIPELQRPLQIRANPVSFAQDLPHPDFQQCQVLGLTRHINTSVFPYRPVLLWDMLGSSVLVDVVSAAIGDGHIQ
jgi:hypothetical protein